MVAKLITSLAALAALALVGADDAGVCAAGGCAAGEDAALLQTAVHRADSDKDAQGLDEEHPPFSQPGRPDYSPPGRPPYGRPDYGEPGRPPFGGPGRPPYGPPGRPPYGRPDYGEPGRPPFGGPGRPPYGPPGRPPYGRPDYGEPGRPPFGGPGRPPYGPPGRPDRPDNVQKTCANNGQDPFGPSFNGQCCSGLYKIKSKFYDQQCRYRCERCTAEGRDVNEHCSCGGCYSGGEGNLPCCPGLTERNEGGKRICRRGGYKPGYPGGGPGHGGPGHDHGHGRWPQ